MENNLRMLRRTDERWGILRTREEDEQKKPLISYTEWIAIEGKVRELSLEEQEGATRWYLWEKRPNEENGNACRI